MMKDILSLTLMEKKRTEAARELRECNDLTRRFGLSLTEEQIHELVEKSLSALKDTGRMEWGQGILKKLARGFCDSPYLNRENYWESLSELTDLFYYFKNDALDLISDDELISAMRKHFDGECQGSLAYLGGTTLAELCRRIRFGYDEEDRDF